MKAIVTGSEGFIGKALVATLNRIGYEVIGIDRKSGIEAGEYFMNADLSDVDCVYHLAAQTSVFNTNKTDIIRDNIDAFRIVCDACVRHGCKFVYASSSTAAPGNTTSLYGITKHFDEQYAGCYCSNSTGVRFHNVYGPNPRQGTLLWYLMTQDSVELYNRGLNVRHYTYIDDIIEGLLYARHSNESLLNVANPECLSTYDFACEVARHKSVIIQRVAEIRKFDRFAQSIESGIITIPLQYTTVAQGLSRIFDQLNDTCNG